MPRGTAFFHTIGEKSGLEADAFVAEGQHLFRSELFKLTSGFGFFTTTQREIAVTIFSPPATPEEVALFPPGAFDPGGSVGNIVSRDHNDIERGKYSQFMFPRSLTLTLGASADFYEADGEAHNQINPKLGVAWSPVPDTTFRAAWFRVLEPGQNTVQTIEPTQLAGFNQLFRSSFEQDFVGAFFPGIDVWRFGGGLDQAIGGNAFTGIEYSERDLTVPGIGFKEEWNEHLGRAYFYWTPLDMLALSAEYQFERLERGDFLGAKTGVRTVETHRVPLGINIFHSSGLRFGLNASYVDQRGRFVPRFFESTG